MNTLDGLGKYAHWTLRIALASVFIYHGVAKLMDLSGSAEMMGQPIALWAIVALLETIGGILILAGGAGSDTLTRVGALMLIPPMLGAIFTVHLANGWNFMNGGAEFQTTLLLVSLFMLLVGNGVNRGFAPR